MAKMCFDTSVLVAALVQQHPHHALAFPHLEKVREGQVDGFVTTHGLAELFATLSALPLKPRLQPTQVQRLIRESVEAHFKLVQLTAENYSDAIQLTVLQNLSSGAIYDALHLVGARSAQCDALLTLNLRHFRALAPDDESIVGP